MSKTTGLGAALIVALGTAATASSAQESTTAEGRDVMQDLDRRMGEVERLRKAPGGAKGSRETFAFLDENGDGVIDRTEWNVRKMRIFMVRDVNDDEKLSPAEVPAVGPDAFASADTNGDGFIDGLEFNQASFMQFDHDRSKTGPMEFDEFEAIMLRLSE